MGSRFRPLYDKIYTDIDLAFLSHSFRKSAKKRIRTVPKNANLDAEYRKNVLPYWKQFGQRPGKVWYHLYCEKDEHIDPRYLPDDIWTAKIVPHFNTLLFARALQDKNLNNLLVPWLKHPKTVVKNVAGVYYDDELNLISEQEAVTRCLSAGRMIVKPSVGSGRGAGIQFLNGCDLTEKTALKLFRSYQSHNFLIQEKVKQHETLAAIHPRSLNTLRVVTFLYKNEVRVLSSVLRIGAGESELDNISAGGYCCKVHDNGRLDKLAVTRKGEWVTAHPDGAVFGEITLPNYSHILDCVKNAASHIGHFRILGWDIAVDQDAEPVFIEYNVIPDQNQKTFGPTFGDLTDEILHEVFCKEEH